MSLLVDLGLEILENAMVDHLVSAEVGVVVWLVVLRVDVKEICQGEEEVSNGCLLCIHLLIVQVRRTTKEIVNRPQYSLILLLNSYSCALLGSSTCQNFAVLIRIHDRRQSSTGMEQTSDR